MALFNSMPHRDELLQVRIVIQLAKYIFIGELTIHILSVLNSMLFIIILLNILYTQNILLLYTVLTKCILCVNF